MNTILRNWAARAAGLAALALSAGPAVAAGQGSVSYLMTADVFTQGAGAPLVGSARYSASVSIGQRSVVSPPISSASFTLESGYQAAMPTPVVVPPVESYSEWITRYELIGADADPDYDHDEDGFTNEEEYVADTDPTRDDSFLHVVSVTRNGNQATISFSSSTARLYQLFFSTDLLDENGWAPVPGYDPRYGVGGPDSMIVEEDPALPQAFYRVRVSLP